MFQCLAEQDGAAVGVAFYGSNCFRNFADVRVARRVADLGGFIELPELEVGSRDVVADVGVGADVEVGGSVRWGLHRVRE